MAETQNRRDRLSGCRPVLLVFLLALAACEATPNAGRCAFVDLDHLSRPRDTGGKTMICDPRRVSPAYRDQYFPGYRWGDETW